MVVKRFRWFRLVAGWIVVSGVWSCFSGNEEVAEVGLPELFELAPALGACAGVEGCPRRAHAVGDLGDGASVDVPCEFSPVGASLWRVEKEFTARNVYIRDSKSMKDSPKLRVTMGYC